MCRGPVDPWAVARTNVSGTVIRLENLVPVCGCGMCVCTDDLFSRTSAPIEVSRFVFVYDEP